MKNVTPHCFTVVYSCCFNLLHTYNLYKSTIVMVNWNTFEVEYFPLAAYWGREEVVGCVQGVVDGEEEG